MKEQLKKCIITRYDETITEAPYLTNQIGSCKVAKPENDEGGVWFAKRLKAACMRNGYVFKFYTSCKKEGIDYELVVY